MRIKKYVSALGTKLSYAFVPLADVGSQSGRLANLYGSTDFSNFINGLFKFAIALGAIVAVLRIAYAGYLYMGSDLWSSKNKAKEILGDVTLGLLLLLSIWLILYQINPDIVSLNALRNIKPVGQQQFMAPGGGTSNPFNTNAGN